MRSILFVCLFSGAVSAAPRDPSRDREAAMLAELQATLERAGESQGREIQSEGSDLDRTQLRAADHPELRADD